MSVIRMHRWVRWLLLGVALAVLVSLLVIPRAASQETRTLNLDVVRTAESIERIRAVGNAGLDGTVLGRGDVLSGQSAVYAAGDGGGERLGTYYFTAVGTADPEHFGTAANHVVVTGYFELFGQGTLAVTGVVSFRAPNTIAITGGSGAFASASGQCTQTPVEGGDQWACQLT